MISSFNAMDATEATYPGIDKKSQLDAAIFITWIF